MDAYISLKEFAKMLNVHPETIRRSIRKGNISAVKLGIGKNSAYRIPYSEIERLGIVNMQKVISKIVDEKIASHE